MGKKMRKFNIQILSGSLQDVIRSIGNPINCEVRDLVDISLKELYEIKYPARKDNFKLSEFNEFISNYDLDGYGNWVYYPWSNLLLRIPPKEDLRLLRTARNQNLITKKEQDTLFSSTILIAGMSVGSNVLDQMLHTGVGGKYILADMDTLEFTNLNRVKSGLTSLSLPKVVVAARKALELDPYLEIYIYEDGINDLAINELSKNGEEINLIVDEVDDIFTKMQLRDLARKLKKPIIMATDNSDGAIIDFERYDLDDSQQIFNGLIPYEILQKMSSGEMSREEIGQAVGRYFVGFDLVDSKLLESLKSVKKDIPSWPQLGTAASISGVLAAYYGRLIILNDPLITAGRFIEDFDKRINSKAESLQ